MNTFLTIQVPTEQYSDSMMEELMSMVNQTDKKLNVYTIGSDLYRLQQNAGYVPIVVDPETFFIIQKGISFSDQSGGVFDITVGPLISLYCFHDPHPHVPTQEELDRILPLVSYKDIQMNEEESTVFLPIQGMYIDLSGILKGYILDKISDFFLNHGMDDYYVNFGGNLSISRDEPLYIGIENPFQKTTQKGFFLSRGFVSTSSSTHQYFEQNGVRYSHIVHPLTGSAQPVIASSTVATWSGIESDFLSTYFFLTGTHPNHEVRSLYFAQSSIFLYHLTEAFEVYAENYSS
ncbi:MAG: FAD:protein FMN transferase [Caldisericia bacterium]|nr:FAD:protein FMN transferase [Caldisericia bacterium]MDD4614450.1 FAD:protein FMN transferase [Caldisericia bacterium]